MTLKTDFALFTKSGYLHTLGPSNSTSKYVHNRNSYICSLNKFIKMFMAALYMIAKN